MNIEQPGELVSYLRRTGHITADERVEMRPLAGGVSNRTVLVKRPNGEQWVLKQALEKLRVPVEWLSHRRRIYHEAKGLRWLQKLTPAGAVPKLIFEDQTHYVLAMAAVEEPHENWKKMLLQERLDQAHVKQFARLLAVIHRKAWQQRSDIKEAFNDRSFFESLRLDPYYTYTAEQVPRAAEFLQQLTKEARSRRITLVHGDYSPKNILIHNEQPVLLDHEVIHYGDPAFDLGFSLTHLLSKAHHVEAVRADFVEAAKRYWQEYRQGVEELPWVKGLEEQVVCHTLGCLLARVAGKSQLEYMSAKERRRQQKAVINLLADLPVSVCQLIDRFNHQIESD